MLTTAAEAQLSTYQVGASALSSLYYISEYISEAEEQRILGEVRASQAKWVQLSGRRLQNHGGIVHAKGLISAPMPRWLEQLGLRIHNHLPLFGDQPPNHVLINSYQPGCGIMPHQDGPVYHPVVCILSLGSPAVLRFWRKQPESGTGNHPPVASLLAMPRSLLVFADEAYEDCLHGIEEVTEEVIDASVVNPEVLQQYERQQCEVQQEQQGVMQNEQQVDLAQQQCPSEPSQMQQHLAPDMQRLSCSTQQAQTLCGCNCNRSNDGVRTVPRQGERVSLTIRRVLKVHKALGLLRR